MFTKNQILNWIFEEGAAEILLNWAEEISFTPSPNENVLNFVMVISDREDDDAVYVIRPETIRKGIRVGFENRKTLGDPYQQQVFTDLQFGKWDDVDYDAFTADYLIQFALFGEVRYS